LWCRSCGAEFVAVSARRIVGNATKKPPWTRKPSNPNRFAAIVYDDGDKVDALMTSFARELVEAGVDAQGIVQLPPEGGGCGPGVLMKLCDVTTGEVIPLCQSLGPGAGSCRLDSSALAGAAEAAAGSPSRYVSKPRAPRAILSLA